MDLLTNNMEMIWDVGKWILLILATGFIAQFGKQFATYLITKLRKDKSANIDNSVSMNGSKGQIDKKQLKQLAKIEKKRIKNLEKSQK